MPTNPWDQIILHNRGCECYRCCPWANHHTTARQMASHMIYTNRQDWERLGCPATIEDYYKACQELVVDAPLYKYENGEFKPL